jgi:hypothetical protein
VSMHQRDGVACWKHLTGQGSGPQANPQCLIPTSGQVCQQLWCHCGSILGVQFRTQPTLMHSVSKVQAVGWECVAHHATDVGHTLPPPACICWQYACARQGSAFDNVCWSPDAQPCDACMHAYCSAASHFAPQVELQ